ncbi:MAG: DNA polymerase IV [Myxococcales bacterium]|nr:DNA polymerase IV [Myxococcales bacterium]
MPRTILHVDLDAFYASVEQRDDPSLRGRKVVVGPRSKRGVVLAASYEARPSGVKSAMPMARALLLCPDLVVVPPRMARYAQASAQFFALLAGWSPLVEGLSLDEAFLDVTGEERLLGDGKAIARGIKQQVREEIGLVASVGVAPNKFVAKIASDLGKPDGLVEVDPDRVREFLQPLAIGRLWGVGAVTEAALARLGLATIGDVARIGETALAGRLGADGARRLFALAEGRDERAVIPDRAPVSVGSEETFERDVHLRAHLAPSLLAHTDRVCRRVRALGLRARTVTVKVKYADHELCTRRVTLARSTADGRVVARTALELLEVVPAIEQRGARLVGISLSGLVAKDGPRQLSLDEPATERGEHLGETIDRITDRFGGGAVTRAVLLSDGEPRRRRPVA